MNYLFSDPQGTGQIAVSSANAVTSYRRFDPYGNARTTGGVGAWPDGHGFLDKPVNATTALVHLGAREYDPVQGRFWTTDPLLVVDDPGQWNAYQYSGSNPTSFTDPGGTCRKVRVDDDKCVGVATGGTTSSTSTSGNGKGTASTSGTDPSDVVGKAKTTSQKTRNWSRTSHATWLIPMQGVVLV